MLLLRYLEREFPAAEAEAQAAFEQLLSAQDPEIVDLLAGRLVAEDPRLNDLILRLLANAHH